MASKGIAHREWAIRRSDYHTDEDFRAAVENEMVLNVHLLDRLGVALVIAPFRQESGGEWFTDGVVFQTATVPAVREPEAPTPIVAEAPEAEPVSAD